MNRLANARDLREPGELGARRFVLLQGPSSPFFAKLGRALRADGADVARVGFCPGDRLYWARGAGRYLAYRGTLDAFGDWLVDLLRRDAATDLVALGDGRDVHWRACAAIREAGLPIRIWIVEHGYLRPNLILVEPEGMGAQSSIPGRFLAGPLAVPTPVDPTGPVAGASFSVYAAMDVAYHAANLLLAWLRYPHYRAHSGIHPLREYGGWVQKIVRTPSRRRGRAKALADIAAHAGPLFLFPLQLSQDAQLTRSGTGEPQEDVLDRVVTSFLANAPPEARLVVKLHPIDNGLTDWFGRLSGHGDRVIFLDGGDLEHLLNRVDGVVTINSTVGLQSLAAGRPTLALGQAIYRAAGLSAAQSMDTFWGAPETPDAARVERFVVFLKAGFHVPGTFDGQGAATGAETLAAWLLSPPQVALGPPV
ncbi:MAG: capsular biosynthesis protein [Pseudomonadota bacterium]